MDVSMRPARPADVDDVVSFTRDTWADRDRGDYLPDVFQSWVSDDDPDRRTVVADADGRAVGTIQAVLLSETEAWLQGLRVAPEHRGRGIGTRLTHAGFSWARDQGAAVARSMVFSWNEMGLGLARTAGFEPVTEFRWAHPEPKPEAQSLAEDADVEVAADPSAAWAFWRASEACTHLDGLALDMDESWALSRLDRDRLERAAAESGFLTVAGSATRAFAYRTRTVEAETEDGEETRLAEYGVGAWVDSDACTTLLDAIARDAADCDADRTRVLIPETAAAVSDVALAGHRLADSPDFVLEVDLRTVSSRD